MRDCTLVPIVPSGLLRELGPHGIRLPEDEIPQDGEHDDEREEAAGTDPLRHGREEAPVLRLTERAPEPHEELPVREGELDVLAEVRHEDHPAQPHDPLGVEGDVAVLSETRTDLALGDRARRRLDRLEPIRTSAGPHEHPTPEAEGDHDLSDLTPRRPVDGPRGTELLDGEGGVVAPGVEHADGVEVGLPQLADLERADDTILRVGERSDRQHPERVERLLTRRGVRGVVRVDLRPLGVQLGAVEGLDRDHEPVDVEALCGGLASVLGVDPELERLAELDGRQDVTLSVSIGTGNTERGKSAHRRRPLCIAHAGITCSPAAEQHDDVRTRPNGGTVVYFIIFGQAA